MKQIGASAPQPVPSPMRDSDSAPSHATYCLRAVRVMYGFYRKSEAFDPNIFSVGAAAVLEKYPLDVVDLVTDVRTGLPSRMKFPPEVKDIRDACNQIMEERERRQRRNGTLRKQFAERDEYERELAERAKHPTRKQLEKKLGRPIKGEKERPPLTAPQLWARWLEHRAIGATINPEAKAILEAAGYKIDGHDDQNPQGGM